MLRFFPLLCNNSLTHKQPTNTHTKPIRAAHKNTSYFDSGLLLCRRSCLSVYAEFEWTVCNSDGILLIPNVFNTWIDILDYTSYTSHNETIITANNKCDENKRKTMNLPYQTDIIIATTTTSGIIPHSNDIWSEHFNQWNVFRIWWYITTKAGLLNT